MIYYLNGETKPYLNNKDIEAMADIMSDAFMEHHNWVRVIKNGEKRKKALYSLFLTMFKVINKYGHIVVSTEDDKPIGYITYMANNDKKQMSLGRIIKVGALSSSLKFFKYINTKEMKSLISFNKTIGKFYNDYSLDSNGLHLYSTGINPEYKGKGYMSKAFRYAEEVFKQKNITSIMLETTDPTNLPIYEKLNFKMVSEYETNDKNQTIYFMQLTL